MTDEVTKEEWAAIAVGLAARFPEEQIKSYEGAGGRTLSYIDARAVMNRLDEVVGPPGWSDIYTVVDRASGAVECTLTIHDIDKSDVGYPNNPIGTTTKAGELLEEEPLKASYSDALKRAAVKWGIGRHLYEDKSSNKGEQRDARGGKEATDKQKALIEKLCRERSWPIPNMDGLPLGEAKKWIDTIFAHGTPDFGPRVVPHDTAPATMPFGPDEPARERVTAPPPPATNGGSEKPITENQRVTIQKLCRVLGEEPPANLSEWSSNEASPFISTLSGRVNEKGKASRG